MLIEGGMYNKTSGRPPFRVLLKPDANIRVKWSQLNCNIAAPVIKFTTNINQAQFKQPIFRRDCHNFRKLHFHPALPPPLSES